METTINNNGSSLFDDEFALVQIGLGHHIAVAVWEIVSFLGIECADATRDVDTHRFVFAVETVFYTAVIVTGIHVDQFGQFNLRFVALCSKPVGNKALVVIALCPGGALLMGLVGDVSAGKVLVVS